MRTFIDLIVVQNDDEIHNKYTITDSLESDKYYIKSNFNVSFSNPFTMYRTVRNIAIIDRPSLLLNLPVFQIFHLLRRRTSSVNPFTMYRTVRNIAIIDRPSLLLNLPVFQIFHLLRRRTSSVNFCALL